MTEKEYNEAIAAYNDYLEKLKKGEEISAFIKISSMNKDQRILISKIIQGKVKVRD